MKTLTDCRQYRCTEPCVPHKQVKARCDQCNLYDPITERILMVKLAGMGDVLRTTACLSPLKKLYPHSHITWITRSSSVPVLARNPLIDRLISVESNYLEFLLAEHFELALGPDTDLLSASIMQITNAEQKRGFVADGRGGVTALNEAAQVWWQMGLDDEAKRANRSTYGEWLYAICELPLPVACPSLHLTDEVRQRVSGYLLSQAPKAEQFVCFNTGGSTRWQEKRWKIQHYDALARMIATAAPSTVVVLVGGSAESEINHHLLGLWPKFIDGGTNNSIEEFAAIIAASAWVLTPDSLGYHVACAVGTRALCLVGPTSPWELDLYGKHQVFYSDLPCIGCYLASCPFPVTCMDRLTASTIWPRIQPLFEPLLDHNSDRAKPIGSCAAQKEMDVRPG